MKRIFTIVAALLMTASTWAQSPEKMSYQAVVRNTNNALVATQAVGMQISILQGGVTGTPVYVETQTPSTNANGLVSLEIGTGTIVSGDFTTIDWANDIYFIKTETDPTGGTTYTITGTSQLMSVPYALHAKTAESITGTVDYTETDPEYTGWDKSTGIAITESQITDLVHTVDTDTHLDAAGVTALGFTGGAHTVDTDTQLDEAAVDAFVANNGYLTSFTEVDGSITNEIELPTTANTGDMSYWNGTSWALIASTPNEGATLQMVGGVPTWTGGTPPPAIGDFTDGGIVIWVDPTDNSHGLVVDMNDLSSSAQWGCIYTDIPGADGTTIGSGAQNTIDIVAGCTTPGTAADLCVNSTSGGYSDWFLPSIDALIQVYNNLSVINNAITTNGGTSIDIAWYWSSTEQLDYTAFATHFIYGNVVGEAKSWSAMQVRGVRAF